MRIGARRPAPRALKPKAAPAGRHARVAGGGIEMLATQGR